MDALLQMAMNVPKYTLQAKVVSCPFGQNVKISGDLYGGLFLLFIFHSDGFANITALSYWGDRTICSASIENRMWAKRFERMVLSSDLKLYVKSSNGSGTKKIISTAYNTERKTIGFQLEDGSWQHVSSIGP